MIQGLPEEEYFESGHTGCAGCCNAIAVRNILKAAGKDTIVVIATGCTEVYSTPYPLTSWKLPCIHNAFENAASTASGIEAALKRLNKKTKVLVIAGDGCSYDIGFGALSGMIERGHNICYVCTNNESYANTGVQRSGATPKYANTTTTPREDKIHGKMQLKKPLPRIVAAHGDVYVANANLAFPQDLFKKVRKGLEFKGPAYIDVFCPCPTGWKFDPSMTVEVARKGVETGFNTLYEIIDGKLIINKKIEKRKPVREFLKLQGRFKGLTEKEIKEIQEKVDKELEFFKSGVRFY
jgi:pyruvate ferredoxin oxidoreductase beta subunit